MSLIRITTELSAFPVWLCSDHYPAAKVWLGEHQRETGHTQVHCKCGERHHGCTECTRALIRESSKMGITLILCDDEQCLDNYYADKADEVNTLPVVQQQLCECCEKRPACNKYVYTQQRWSHQTTSLLDIIRIAHLEQCSKPTHRRYCTC